MIEPYITLTQWAQGVIGTFVDAAGEAIDAFCQKPRSAKRLHRTRKRLARLRAVLQDFSTLAGVEGAFSDRVRRLYKRAGKVREAQVLLERVERYRDDATDAECGELDRLHELLQKRVKRTRRKLRRELSA